MATGGEALFELATNTSQTASPATSGSWSTTATMNAAEIDGVLAYRRIALISSTRRDGRPRSVTGGFVYHEDELWLPTSRGAARRDDVAVHPALVLVVHEGDADDEGLLLVEGATRAIDTDGTLPVPVVAAYRDKYGQGLDWIASWLVLTPTRAFTHRGPDWVAPGPARSKV
jgi:hypothetical protein